MLSITTPFAHSPHDVIVYTLRIRHAQIRLLFFDVDGKRGRMFSWTEGGEGDRDEVGDIVTMQQGFIIRYVMASFLLMTYKNGNESLCE